jgi:hypothetical protein
MRRYKTGMLEFVHGKCKAMKEPREFSRNWIKTNGNPCSVCGTDKPMCCFYKDLVSRGAINE